MALKSTHLKKKEGLYGARQIGKTALIELSRKRRTSRRRPETGADILVHEALPSLEFPGIPAFVEVERRNPTLGEPDSSA